MASFDTIAKVVQKFGQAVFDLLLRTADNDTLTAENLFVLAQKIDLTGKVAGNFKRKKKEKDFNYGRQACKEFFCDLEQRSPNELTFHKVIDVLEGNDLSLNSLANDLKEVYEKDEPLTQIPTSETRKVDPQDASSNLRAPTSTQRLSIGGNVGGMGHSTVIQSTGTVNITTQHRPQQEYQEDQEDQVIKKTLLSLLDEKEVEDILKEIVNIPLKTNNDKRTTEAILRQKPIILKNLLQSVCMVEGPVEGTAFLASIEEQGVLLSAGHVFPPTGLEKEMKKYTLCFNAVMGDSKRSECIKVPMTELMQKDYTIISNYKGKQIKFGNNNSPVYSKVREDFDFFALRLNSKKKKSLKKKNLKFLTTKEAVSTDEAVFYVGHPDLGKETRELVISHGNIKSIEKHLATYDLDTEGGASGSPIIGDSYSVVAIHVLGSKQNNKGQLLEAVFKVFNDDEEESLSADNNKAGGEICPLNADCPIPKKRIREDTAKDWIDLSVEKWSKQEYEEANASLQVPADMLAVSYQSTWKPIDVEDRKHWSIYHDIFENEGKSEIVSFSVAFTRKGYLHFAEEGSNNVSQCLVCNGYFVNPFSYMMNVYIHNDKDSKLKQIKYRHSNWKACYYHFRKGKNLGRDPFNLTNRPNKTRSTQTYD